MNFREWLNQGDFAITGQVPPEPGTTPIPPNHVRLYHYTKFESTGNHDQDKFQAAQLLRQNGLDISKAKGNTYGEPNVVWASAEMPRQIKVFAEFTIAVDDPRWAQSKPEPGQTPQEYEARKADCYFRDSILPNEIIAVHEPWHFKYRYIMADPTVQKAVIDGEHDRLMDKEEYGPAVRRAKAELTRTN
jgi:hypothetical protein